MTMPRNNYIRATARFAVLLLSSLMLCFSALVATGQTPVTTYHYDNYRTGWNSAETTLTPTNVASSAFGLLHTVALDDQVDNQPLLVPAVNITAGKQQGTHGAGYVAAGKNSIFAVDQHHGGVFL